MTKLLHKQIDKLKQGLLHVGAEVEKSLDMAIESVGSLNTDLARQVIARDQQIDEMEVELEEECLKVLALYQPVAVDLRLIVAILKINNDLERIADLAVNIAERVMYLSKHQKVDMPYDFDAMAKVATKMLHCSLQAIVELDANLAYQVCAWDQQVDDMHRGVYPLVEKAIRDHPEQMSCLTRMISISRFIERIADHATNIAEDVIYLLQGEIVRHRLGSSIQNPYD